MTNIRFIQFPHPGEEHRPGSGGKVKEWNWLKNPPTSRRPKGSDNSHRRTFFQANGKRLTEGGLVHGPLWAWGEWEAEARVIRSLQSSGREPTTLFEPYWKARSSFENLHNTDPFVFGGFYYTDCKQGTHPSLRGMLALDVGTLIVFGSGLKDAGNDMWVLDTVFVVGDYIDHDVSNFHERLQNRIPNGYEQIVLGPTYGEHAERRGLPRRLYIGATYDRPVHGMYSFFPCTAGGGQKGFARPRIQQNSVLTSEFFNPKLRQGMKGHKLGCEPLSLKHIHALWTDLHDQVRASGCDLGVWADMPSQSD